MNCRVRSVAMLALLVAAVVWLLNYIVQRAVLVVLIVMTLALSGCYWIVPDTYYPPPNIDLLCRPWWRGACQPDVSGGVL